MKIMKLSCENCKGNTDLKVENGQKFIFCPYCGQKYMVNDGKIYMEINRTERKIDEARIKEAEVREKIKLKELEMKERENERKRKGRKIAFTIALIIFVLGLVASLIFPMAGIGGGVIAAWIALFAFISGEDNKK